MELGTYIVVTFCVLAVTLLIHRHVKYRNFWLKLEDFYGWKTLPIIGNGHELLGMSNEEMLWKMYELFKEANYTTYKFVIGKDVMVGLCDPDTIEVLLSSNKELTKMDEYNYFKEWLGDGLLTSAGQKWRARRKLITPTFHFKILEQFVKVFNSNGDVFIKQLAVKEEQLFDVYPFVNMCTLDIICESAMGVSIDAQTNSDSEYVTAVHSVCKLIKERVFSPAKRINWYYKLTKDYIQHKENVKTLHKMTNSVIKARKDLLKELIERVRIGEATVEEMETFVGKRKRVAFLDLLLLSKLPDGSFLTDDEVREEVDTFMFAGHDTTTSAITFALYCLANDDAVQERAFEEVKEIIGDDPDVELTYEMLQKMKYLEMVIKETLRLYPSVPGFGRRLENDMKFPDGKTIPKGCLVFADIFALGRNPRYYPDHDRFDPERFSPEHITGKNPFLFVPFSAGSRNCIGQKFAMLEIKSILTKTLMNYKLSTVKDGENNKLNIVSEIILKPVNGANIILNKRDGI